MNFEEMKLRYDAGEDSLQLTLEKWDRIYEFSKNVFHLNHFQELLKAAVVPIFLCPEYANQCTMCPIYTACKQGTSDEWSRVIRLIQAYAIAGEILPLEPLLGHIEGFVKRLRACSNGADYTMDN